MNKLYKNFVQSYLAFCLKILFFKHNPIIIGVLGEGDCQKVLERIGNCLRGKIDFRLNPKDYNDKITLPLGILNLRSGGQSILKWLNILIDAISIAFFSAKFPPVIVVDLKISQTDEIDYFLKLIKPRVAVFTALNLELKNEYLKLANHIPERGIVLLNRDDEAQGEVGFLNTHVKYYSLAKPGELEKLVADYALGKYAY